MLMVTPMQDVAVPPEMQETLNVEPVPEEQPQDQVKQNAMEPISTEHVEEVDASQPSNEENTAQCNTQEAIVPVRRSA